MLQATLIVLVLGLLGAFIGILLHNFGVVTKPADWYLYGVVHAYITLWVVRKYIT